MNVRCDRRYPDEASFVLVPALKVCISHCTDKGHTYAGTEYSKEVKRRSLRITKHIVVFVASLAVTV